MVKFLALCVQYSARFIGNIQRQGLKVESSVIFLAFFSCVFLIAMWFLLSWSNNRDGFYLIKFDVPIMLNIIICFQSWTMQKPIYSMIMLGFVPLHGRH